MQSSLCPAQTILSCIRNDYVFCRPCGCVSARCGLRLDASFCPDQANLLTPGSQIKPLRPTVKAEASAPSAALSSGKRFLRHTSTGRFHVRQPVPAPPPDGLPAYYPLPGRMSCQTAASAMLLTAERTAQTLVPARRAEVSAAQLPDTGDGTNGLCSLYLPCTDLYFVYFSVSRAKLCASLPLPCFFQYTTGQISWQSCLPLSAANENCPAGRSDILLSETGLTGRLRIYFLSVIFRNIHTKVFL